VLVGSNYFLAAETKESFMAMTEPVPGRRTSISKDPIGVDPIGNDPLDLSDAPPRKDAGPNQSVGGWTATATRFFIAAVILGVIMGAIILYMANRA
jgi:hypothetical protein